MKNCVRKIGILISENFNLILKSFCVFGGGGGIHPCSTVNIIAIYSLFQII